MYAQGGSTPSETPRVQITGREMLTGKIYTTKPTNTFIGSGWIKGFAR